MDDKSYSFNFRLRKIKSGSNVVGYVRKFHKSTLETQPGSLNNRFTQKGQDINLTEFVATT